MSLPSFSLHDGGGRYPRNPVIARLVLLIGRRLESWWFSYLTLRARDEFERNSLLGPGARIFPSAACVNFGPREEIHSGRGLVCRGVLYRARDGGHIELGDGCYIGDNTTLFSLISIKLGNNVHLGYNILITDNAGHPLHPAARSQHVQEILSNYWSDTSSVPRAPVEIGENTMIHPGSIILAGVTIGPGATIAAGSIVTHDIPAYAIAAGNPAVVKRILPP